MTLEFFWKMSRYTKQEFADMFNCYIDSGKDFYLAQTLYANIHHKKQKPHIATLKKVVQNFQNTLASTSTANSNEVVVKFDSENDDRIIKYFITNSHATTKKAASIFNVNATYVETLIQRKTKLLSKIEDDPLSENEPNLKDYSRRKYYKKYMAKRQCIKKEKDVKSESEEDMCSRVKQIENNTIKEELEIENSVDTSLDLDETQDEVKKKFFEVDTCSESFKNEPETTIKKRKKRSTLDANKKLRTFARDKNNASTPDPNEFEISYKCNCLVYTTKLEEMSVLHGNLKRLDAAQIIEEIIRESKPKYNSVNSGSCQLKIIRTMNFQLLKSKLKQLRKKKVLIDLTVDNPIQTVVINLPNNVYTFDIDHYMSRRWNKVSDIVIIITNIYLNEREIYVTDIKGNVIEYHYTKPENDIIVKDINPNKVRLTFDTCCWYHRQRKINTIWPMNEYSFSKFLKTNHKCSLAQCICCCRPKDIPTKSVLYTPNETNVFEDGKLDVYNKNLISKALQYKNPESNRNENGLPKVENFSKQFAFWESVQHKKQKHIKFEYCEVGSKLDVLFHAFSYFPENHMTGPRYNSLGLLNDYKNQIKFQVCCNWKRNCFLISLYTKSTISERTLKFLQKTVNPYICDECKKIKEWQENKQTKVVVNATSNVTIEHTKEFIKPTLLKIGYTSKKTLHTERTDKKPQLIITCKQIPGTEFIVSNVDKQLAAEFVKKFNIMRFTIKEDGKVIATLNSMQTSTEEFQILARMLLAVQGQLKSLATPLGSDIDLIAKVASDNKSSSYKSHNVNAFQTRGQNTTYRKINAKIASYEDPFLNKLNTDRFDNSMLYTENNKNLNSEPRHIRKNLDQLDSGINKITNDAPETSNDDINYSDTYDCFAKLMSCNKKYYAKSFKSYLNPNEDDTSNEELMTPKISSVFSLQGLTTINNAMGIEPFEVYNSVPSTSYKNVQNNSIVPPTLPTGQRTSVDRPKAAKVLYIKPRELNTDSLNKNNVNIKTLIPLLINETNQGILSPTNRFSKSNFRIIPIDVHQLNSVMPDILNDIPKKSDAIASDLIEVKNEEDEEIVILDSD